MLGKEILPWLTSEIKRTMRKRDRLRRKAKKDSSIYSWSKFKIIRNKVVDLLRCAKRNYHESLCTKIKDNKFSNKDWWKLVKQLSNFNIKSNKITALVDDDDNLVTDDLEKADLLNNFFTSQSTIDDSNGILPIYINETVNELENIVISENDVCDILKLLDTTKAVGHDHISPRLLKEGKNELAIPLCTLFNLSLQQKVFPSDWKKANIVPVFKKDDPQKVNNYRPVSLLSVVSKVFERCVYKYIHNFIHDNQLLSQHQLGFREGDSTINQLLYIMHEFSKALDEGKEIRVVFFTLAKHLTEFGIKVYYIKLKSLESKGIYSNGSKAICATGNNGLS